MRRLLQLVLRSSGQRQFQLLLLDLIQDDIEKLVKTAHGQHESTSHLVVFLHALLNNGRQLETPTDSAGDAFDPSFLFVSRHDWGSVALALVFRGGGLYLATTGWARASLVRLAAGGLLLGLGIYNKIDFAPFVAGAGLPQLPGVHHRLEAEELDVVEPGIHVAAEADVGAVVHQQDRDDPVTG